MKESFLKKAIEHGNAMYIGDYKSANKIHKQLQVLYNQIKKQNELYLFKELLEYPNESVRLWASTFSLKFLPVQAEKELEDLSKSYSIIGLSAKTTLALWREGKLNLL